VRGLNYLEFGAIVLGGLAVLGLLTALFGIGLMDLIAARDVPLAATMFALGAVGLAVLRIVGKRLVQNLPQLEPRTQANRERKQ
jgi:hypothetical protein